MRLHNKEIFAAGHRKEIEPYERDIYGSIKPLRSGFDTDFLKT